MYSPIECIALRTTKLSDSKNLLSVWESTRGRLTLAMPAGKSREALRRRALTSPLGLFTAVASIKPGQEIYSVRDVAVLPGTLAAEGSPVKNMTAMFVAEVLDLLLRRTEPEERLSQFLFGSVQALAALQHPHAVASFHLIFLYRLAYFIGIQPSLDDEGAVFDLRSGRFRPSRPLHGDFLEGRECTVLRVLARARYNNAHALPFNSHIRAKILDYILKYYELHLCGLDSLKSLDILRMMAI